MKLRCARTIFPKLETIARQDSTHTSVSDALEKMRNQTFGHVEFLRDGKTLQRQKHDVVVHEHEHV